MNCKDCLHYKVCQFHIDEETNMTVNECGEFHNKSEWVHLPCKVGDTVYYPWVYDDNDGIAFSKVKGIKIYVNGILLVFVYDWESDMPMPTEFYPEEFGKTVFLTREEAEKALEERRQEDAEVH